MTSVVIPERLRMSLTALGSLGQRWMTDLPRTLAALEEEWTITCGAPLGVGNAAYVVEALGPEGRQLVLKVALPPGVEGLSPFDQELETLLIAGGDPYVEVLRYDREARALLLERLGAPLASLGWDTEAEIKATVATLARGWRPVTDDRLPTGSAKADWLAGFVATAWRDLNRPCSEAAVEVAVAFAADCAGRLRRGGRGVLIHGDAHPHNLLVGPAAGSKDPTFKLIDPEGLVSEPAHDLGVALRGWNDDLVAGKIAEVALGRCETASRLTGVTRLAIWQWSVIERLSTGLFLLKLGHTNEARAFLEVADLLAGVSPPR